MGAIIGLLIFSFLSFIGGSFISKIFPIESKIFAGLTAIIFLILSIFTFSLLSGWSIQQLASSNSNMILFVIILTSGYYGFLSNFGKSEETNLSEIKTNN